MWIEIEKMWHFKNNVFFLINAVKIITVLQKSSHFSQFQLKANNSKSQENPMLLACLHDLVTDFTSDFQLFIGWHLLVNKTTLYKQKWAFLCLSVTVFVKMSCPNETWNRKGSQVRLGARYALSSLLFFYSSSCCEAELKRN